MIPKDTVFVLGAGASMPYGFPSGTELGQQICNLIDPPENGPLATKLRSCGLESKLVDDFPEAFRRSARESVDQFLETGRGHAFLDVAKVAMALVLGEREKEKSLTDAPQDKDWMKYLFNRMLGKDERLFRQNRLKVITFNFDRSFERRLFLAVRNTYTLNDHEAGALCREALPVLHFHGDLGHPSWVPTPQEDLFGVSREYEPLGAQTFDVSLLNFAQRIKIIHEEIPQETVDIARSWLQSAQRVCFIGFGYHPMNLQRLNVDAFCNRSSGPTIAGTCLGFEEGELDPVNSTFRHKIKTLNCDAYSFLRKTSFIQELIP
jgi:hypothetical protein